MGTALSRYPLNSKVNFVCISINRIYNLEQVAPAQGRWRRRWRRSIRSCEQLVLPGSEWTRRDVYWVVFAAMYECFVSNSVYERRADSRPTGHSLPAISLRANEWWVLTNAPRSRAPNERAWARSRFKLEQCFPLTVLLPAARFARTIWPNVEYLEMFYRLP